MIEAVKVIIIVCMAIVMICMALWMVLLSIAIVKDSFEGWKDDKKKKGDVFVWYNDKADDGNVG